MKFFRKICDRKIMFFYDLKRNSFKSRKENKTTQLCGSDAMGKEKDIKIGI